MMTTSNPQQRSAEITYTIWFADGQNRQELLTESEMRKAAMRFDFDAKSVISEGSTVMTQDEGETVVGGCFKVEVVELNEDNLSLIWHLVVHALLDRGEEVKTSNPESPLTSENDLPDFELEFVETSSLRELLDICSQINP